MNRIEWLEGVERDSDLLERLDLVLVSKDEPKVTCEVYYLWRIVEQQLLVPMRMPSVLYKH